MITAISVDLLYSSAYLPYVKASLYTTASENISRYKTVDDFKNAFDKVFDFYSPIGQQEIERFLGVHILNIIRNTEQPKSVSGALVNYAEEIFHIDYPTYRGLNFVQNYIILGNIHLENWRRHHEPQDAVLAEKYFLDGLKSSPKRPQFLYGLFVVYTESNQKEKAISVDKEIMKYWPTDQTVKKAK